MIHTRQQVAGTEYRVKVLKMEIGESLVTRLAIELGMDTCGRDRIFWNTRMSSTGYVFKSTHVSDMERYTVIFLIHLLIHSVSLFLSVLARVLGITDRTREQSAEMHLSAQ